MNTRLTALRSALLLTLFLLTAGWGWGQTNYIFNSKSWGTTTIDWTSGKDGNQFQSGRGIQVTTGASGAYGNSPSFSNVSKVEVIYSTNESAGVGTIRVNSVASSAAEANSGTQIGSTFNVTKPSSGGTTEKTAIFNASTPLSGNIQVVVTCSTNSIYIKSVTIYASAAGPTLTATPSSITGLGYMEGDSSTAQIFSVSGSNLDPANGNITVTAPADFQVSKDNTTYSNSVNLPYSGGILSATDVYVRLNSGLSIATYTGNITIAGGGADDATVDVEGIVTPIITGQCFSEDFSDITNGNNTTTGGSGTQWTGNINFPTVVKTYQAGGAVRIGNTTNPRTGSIESRALTEVSGDISVNIMVKGWTTIEGGIKVSIDGQEQSLTYTSTINDPFEQVTAIFYGVTAGSNLKIETEGTSQNANQRCFIDSVEIICGEFPKYFRSRQNGNWNTSSTWESSEDGISWDDATSYPGASAESVVILADHTVIINSPAAVVTNTAVYGTIEVTTAGAYSVEGEQDGIELTIEDGGVFLVNSPGSYAIPAGNAFGLVKTGGKLVAGPNMESGTAFVDAYVGYLYGIFYFGNGGICEWDNSSTVFGSSSPDDNDIFFPYEEDDMPILRIVTTPGHSFGNGSISNILNCVLEIIEPAAFTVRLGASSNPQTTKTIVGGVRGSGKLIMEDNSGPLIIGGNGTYHLDNIVPELGGTATIVTNSTNDRLRFPNGAAVPSEANFTIENNADAVRSFQRIAGTFNINGTLDITNQSITNPNTGGISVNNGGTLRTRHTGGLWGTGSAIPSYTGNLTLNEGSIVEYYATENQAISSGKDYYHIIFSGGGIKTPQNATNVHTNGSITITGNPIVNYTANNLGLTGLNSTNFTMDGGKLIIGTGSNQPRPGGTYNISGGAIEFTGSSVTNIKVGPDYYDVIISGQNKTPNGKTLNIQNILSVTPTGEFIIPSTPDFGSPDFEPPYIVNALKGVQVETGGELVFKNNAQLMQDGDADNNGHIRMERQFTFSDMILGKQYNFVSAPVTNPDTDIKSSIYAPAIPQSVQRYNEADYYFYETNAPYTPGKGYAVQEVEGTDEIGRFTGMPNNGNSLSFMLKKSTPAGGFNLIGNPYPSNLDLDKLYNDNSAGIDPTFYFWDNRGNEQFIQQGSQYEGDHYAKYNALSGTGTSAAVGSGHLPRKPTKNVKAMTGFMVQATSNDVPLNFNNNQRLTESGPGFFGKGQDFDPPQMDRYWLTMETPGGISVMNAVVYFEGGNDDLWLDDTESFGGSDNLYTITDAHKLSIQGRAPFRVNDELPLGYKAFHTGTHIISVYQKEGIFAESQDIWLVDRLLNKIVNLSRKSYKFVTRAGEYANRFKIIYRRTAQPGDVSISINDIRLLKVGQQIEISSTIDRISEVEVFDLNSRPVFKKNEINRNKFSFDIDSFNHQILIIKVKTETGETVTRKFVMN